MIPISETLDTHKPVNRFKNAWLGAKKSSREKYFRNIDDIKDSHKTLTRKHRLDGIIFALFLNLVLTDNQILSENF